MRPSVAFSVSGSRGNTPDMKDVTQWSRSSCLGGRGWWEGCRDIPDTNNATPVLRCSCLGSGKGGRGCRDTPDTKTRHWGRVFLSGVLAASLTVGRVVGRVQGHPRHENATLGSRFLVWGVGSVPDTKNATLWSRSSCLGSGKGGRGWWE